MQDKSYKRLNQNRVWGIARNAELQVVKEVRPQRSDLARLATGNADADGRWTDDLLAEIW